MEKMFSKMMEGCMKGIPEEDKKKVMSCMGKMSAMCSSMGMKDMTDEEKKAMREKMMACCTGKMDLMWNCLNKTDTTSEQACCAEKS